MKVKCPLIVSDGDGGCRRHGCGYRCDRFFMLEVEAPSTADLIAELEKRRPKCEDCIQNIKYLNIPRRCDLCLWREEILRTNKFKEAK
jgi:hypothetical protein